MGDPRKQRKRYKTPSKPWDAGRIESERKIINEYGLKNKREIWKNESFLRRIKRQARRLIPDVSEQGRKEMEQLISRSKKLNLIKEGAQIDDVLALELKDVLERRLQTLVYRRGLSKSVKQARQFIIHRHVMVNGKKMSVPSYMVLREEENKIIFSARSNLSKPDHPERVKEEKKVVDVKTDLKENAKKEEIEIKPIKVEEKKQEVKEEKVEVKKEMKEGEPKIEIKEVEVAN